MNCKKDKCMIDIGHGCAFCEHDQQMSACACEGCYKLHATDWLADYPDTQPSDIFEVRFKNTRKSYYRNVYNLPLRQGDIVAVEASPGHDIGIVSLTGDMVARQMKRVGFSPMNGEIRPPRLLPPPAQPMMTSGTMPYLSSAAFVSRPMTLWCSST